MTTGNASQQLPQFTQSGRLGPEPWEVLFPSAQKLHADKHYAAAVVTAHTACEVIVGRAMAKCTNVDQKKSGDGIPPLRNVMDKLRLGYNVAEQSNRVRKLYCALTGHAIHKEPFWSNFKESAKLRNDIVHNGKQVEAEHSESSLNAAKECIESVANNNGLKCEFETT